MLGSLSNKICVVTTKLEWCYMHLCSTYSMCLCDGNLSPVLIPPFSSWKTPIHPSRPISSALSSGAFSSTHRRELLSPPHYYRTPLDGTLEQGLHLKKRLIPRSNRGTDTQKVHNNCLFNEGILCTDFKFQ